MMLLDIGNTAVKWAIQDQGKLTGRGQFVYRDGDFAGKAGVAWCKLPVQQAVAAANVAGDDIQAAVTGWAEENWHVTPEYIHVTAHAAGITNAYSEPETLGVDRWAAMVAAYHQYGGPVCIVDCGTAITVDVVDATGQHQGGLIAPGASVLKQSLLEGTAGIRMTPADDGQRLTLLASGTQAAVNNGIYYMCSAMIDRVIADIVARSGENTVLVMTGGDAGSLLSLSAWQPEHDPELVLRGVAILAGEPACVT
jgi:type III pantothenate kinase